MEGRLSVGKPPNVGKRLPAVCGFCFFMGGLIEWFMCKTGFYNVYSVREGQKAAAKKAEDEGFWLRVQARREARAKEVEIAGGTNAAAQQSSTT